MKKSKSKKIKKLSRLPTIRNRLFRLWSEAVLSRTNWTCEYCGAKKGDINKNQKKIKIDAHHLFSRNIKDAVLKFDIRNGIAVCPSCHKFGSNSFHRNPIITIIWLQKNHFDRLDFVLNNWTITIDLNNRKILEEIENKLKAKECLDIQKLQEIQKLHPRKKKKNKIEGNLFDSLIEEVDEINQPSSSSDSSEDI